ncbi:MAG: hypothetical protein FJW23_10790 [Acidimicrobiia bacterium]|nr:hypothetical protein [Acidimicrobiia bacterium]
MSSAGVSSDARVPGGGATLGTVAPLPAALILLGAAALWSMTNGVWGATPQWGPVLSWWIRWMVTIGMTSAIFAFRHTPARWVLAAYVCNHALAIYGAMAGLVPMSDGWINVTHVLFWTPAVVLLARSLGAAGYRTAYGVWHRLALATMTMSLVFDYRDAFRYLFLSP